MAYIVPNSNVYLLKDIKLSPNYSDTIYFANTTDQYNYFSNNTKRVATLSANSYQRYNRGGIKVGLPVSTVSQATYMMFKNTSFENKWFYAFVTDWEYINNNTTLIYYQIDELQTWFFDCELSDCYVLREHTMDDTIGLNRVPEPCGSERVMYTQRWACTEMTEYSVVLTASYNGSAWGDNTKFFEQGMFNGLEEKDYSITDEQDAQLIMDTLDQMIGDGTYDENTLQSNQHRVVSLIMFPSAFCRNDASDLTKPYSVNEGFANPRTQVNGYTPRNKKLLTYPFKTLLLTNGIGQSVKLDYDDFKNSSGTTITPAFRIWGVKHGVGQMVCVPQWYKGVENNYDFKITIDNFPMCGFTIDSYRAWLASGGDIKQKTAVVKGVASSIFSLFGSVNQGLNSYNQEWQDNYDAKYAQSVAGRNLNQGALNAVNVGATNYANQNTSLGQNLGESVLSGSFFNGLFNTYANYMEAENFPKIEPDIPVGVTAGNTMVAMKELNFRAYDVDINRQDAILIDEYFDKFGYQTNKLKVPNISGRKEWNYVKTRGCELFGNVPASVKAHICSIFDAGITFWKHGDNLGNYSLDNSL